MKISIRELLNAMGPFVWLNNRNNTMGGHILPDASSAYDIGSPTKPVRKVYAQELVGTFGTSDMLVAPVSGGVPGYLNDKLLVGADMSQVANSSTLTINLTSNVFRSDGTLPITGNVEVNTGVTIDGVDISAHAANADAHHNRVTVSAPLAISTQAISLTYASPLTVTGGTTLDVLLADGVEDSSGIRVKLPTNSGITRDGTGLYLAPSTLTVATTNAVSGAGHTHSITSSSNPGAAASILASDASGWLYLERIYLNGYALLNGTDAGISWADRSDPNNGARRWVLYSNNEFYIYQNGVNLFTFTNTGGIGTSGDMTLDPSGGEIFIPGADTLRSVAWTPGLLGTGWGIQERAAGKSHLDIRSIYTDELIATTFTADQVRVRSGSDWLGESMAIATRDNSDAKVTIPNVGGSVSIFVEDAPEVTGPIFDTNEYVLIKTISRASGLVIRETWGQVAWYSDEVNGRQSYSWTTVSGSGNFTLEPGTALIGFGVSAGSYIYRTVIEAGRGPYERFATWATNPYTPANRTSRVEIGDIRNAVGDGTTRYGIAAGNNLALTPTTGFSGFTADSVNGVQVFNGAVSMYDGASLDLQINTNGVRIKRELSTELASVPALNSVTWYSDFVGGTVSQRVAGYRRGSNEESMAVYCVASLTDTATATLESAHTGGPVAIVITQATSLTSAVYLYAAYLELCTSAGSIVRRSAPGFGTAYTIWDSGNDGSGSGLDADYLDGQHAGAFARYNVEQEFTATQIISVGTAVQALSLRHSSARLRFYPYVDANDGTAIQAVNPGENALTTFTIGGSPLRLQGYVKVLGDSEFVGVSTMSQIQLGNPSTISGFFQGNGSTDLRIWSNGTTNGLLLQPGSGNVTIGALSPRSSSSKLTVNGHVFLGSGNALYFEGTPGTDDHYRIYSEAWNVGMRYHHYTAHKFYVGSWSFVDPMVSLTHGLATVYSRLNAAELSVNDAIYIQSGASDGRIWTSGRANGLLLEPGGGTVTIGAYSPLYSAKLTVSGGNIHCTGVVTSESYMQIYYRSGAPAAGGTGWARIYYDSSDDKLKYLTGNGNSRTLNYT